VPAEVSHVLALFCDAGSGKAYFYTELFNLPSVVVSMPYSESLSQVHTHAVEILEGKEIDIPLAGEN